MSFTLTAAFRYNLLTAPLGGRQKSSCIYKAVIALDVEVHCECRGRRGQRPKGSKGDRKGTDALERTLLFIVQHGEWGTIYKYPQDCVLIFLKESHDNDSEALTGEGWHPRPHEAVFLVWTRAI